MKLCNTRIIYNIARRMSSKFSEIVGTFYATI